MRLKWPGELILHEVRSESTKTPKVEIYGWVNVGFQDFELRQRLSGLLDVQGR